MFPRLGLLMGTGFIVDAAIVIAESVRAHERKNPGSPTAAVDGTHAVARPVLASSLTTIITFLPLMYVEGVMGRFIFLLPVVVIAAIVFSGVEAFVILPAHLNKWSHRRSNSESRPSRPARMRKRLDTAIDRVAAR